MRTSFRIVRALMIKDNYLNELIMEFEEEHKRDVTIEEENQMITDMAMECEERMKDLSCSVVEAYNDIMY